MKAIATTKAPAAVGPYNQAIQVGNTLYISGQLAIDPTTAQFSEGDIAAHTEQVMKNIGVILAEANMQFSHIVKCSIFLKDMNQFGEVNKVYASYFGEIPPAREMVEVARLPLDGQVEISAIAVKE